MAKYVYAFHEGHAEMRELLGGKGANLAEMMNLGLPVPPGITITTEACRAYYHEGGRLPAGLEDELAEHFPAIEAAVGKTFGSTVNPLLVSVRSGAKFSMPGMMDTILNLGLNDDTVEALATRTGDRRFAYDAYRRFIQMFGDVVLEIPKTDFEVCLNAVKQAQGAVLDQELSAEALQQVVASYKQLIKDDSGTAFPQDPKAQLLMSIKAVFRSWNNDRAIVYRHLNKIPDDLGTAVNIQVMVFGNMGACSGTGVAFSRNPATGEKALYGEYLMNAQGEDVVAGTRTPQPIGRLQAEMPEIYTQFAAIAKQLETHYRNMQDIELTIEQGKLYILQTRNGKRTAAAAVKIACDMVREGLITKLDALQMVDAGQFSQLLHRRIDPEAVTEVLATGLPASPGAGTGQVVFDADEAETRGKSGEHVLLVRTETTPDDIHGIVGAQGILTSRGGMTSHAAVVARGMGKPCVCGCSALQIDYEQEWFTVGDVVVKKGDVISVDGSTGQVILGAVALQEPEMSPEYQQILVWADEYKHLAVRANADTPQDAQRAREFGAEGIGLCRTEHMFMGQDRLPYVQQMILADTLAEREAALAKLMPMQEEDFYGIFRAMAGFPVTIRLLDPPLHEFLPAYDELLTDTARLQVTARGSAELAAKEKLLHKVKELHEFNPMLGHRGCRLGITYPEIYEMQIEAVFRAVARLLKEQVVVLPEIEIPLTIDVKEMQFFHGRIDRLASAVANREGVKLVYKVGTMIELPRACLMAADLATDADFFSFGTNDLTQTTLGFSRDDAEGKFMPRYLNRGILPEDPFIAIDQRGVGQLMKLAVVSGRGVKPDMTIGICGEHGGEPSSVAFCHEIGLDYVSCSPYRVPIARLAAAQAAIGVVGIDGTK